MRTFQLFAAVVLLPILMATAAADNSSFYLEDPEGGRPSRARPSRRIRGDSPARGWWAELGSPGLHPGLQHQLPSEPDPAGEPQGRAVPAAPGKAQAALQTSLRRNPGDAESHALLGSIYGAQISLSPLKAITLGPRVAAAFAEAEKLAPANPRVPLQKGISLLFVPRALGGGPESAEKELRRAEALFAQEPAAKTWPNWGRLDVLAWLGQVRARQGDSAGARIFYRQALALDPGYAWASLLLDQLERR